ncbi:MAG: M15 family metallopeptidase [Pseudomonadota bacterium]
MYKFSRSSQERLASCDERIQRVCKRVIMIKDFTVLEGTRSQERQEQLFSQGKSKLQWPNSKHNTTPSLAIDIAPYPIDWHDLAEFRYLAGLMVGTGHEMGIALRWGGDWNMNGALSDNRFNDLPHFELIN